jgi:hypothetical protein
MPDNDTLGQLFGELAAAELPVPAPAGVVARGRQRRRQQRIMASVTVLALIAAGGSAVAYARGLAGHRAGGTEAGPASPGGHRKPVGQRGPAVLPPPGKGLLVLGLGTGGGFAMARIGSTAAVPVPGLRAVVANQSLVATNPAGGWVVTVGVGKSQLNMQAERLATVSPQGVIHKFGPVFSRQRPVTSIAVRPDGAAVAVAVTRLSSRGNLGSAAQIDVLLMPGWMPGAGLASRTWTLASASMTLVEDLSWAPGGTRLTYIPGSDATGGGFSGTGPVTLDTSAAGNTAGVISHWPADSTKTGCALDAGAWAGNEYLALETCDKTGTIIVPANVDTGPVPGTLGIRVTGPAGCGGPALDPISTGGQILISYCGLFLDNHDHVSSLPAPLSGAAWAGVQR